MKIFVRKIIEMISDNITNLYKVFLLLSVIIGAHFFILCMPDGENYQTRKDNNIIESCISGWFSSPTICEKYKQYITSETVLENNKAKNEEEVEEKIPYCGLNNEKCQLKGLKDYLTQLIYIVEFGASIYVGWMIGVAYTNKNISSIRFSSWVLILSWHALILLIVYIQNGLLFFAGDIARQLLELFVFIIMLKIKGPKKEKKKKKK